MLTSDAQQTCGLKRSLHCIDLSSMATSGSESAVGSEATSLSMVPSSVNSLEQAARDLLGDHDVFDLSLFKASKRLRIRYKDSDDTSDDVSTSSYSDATPATDALERSLAETNAVVDQLELTLSMSAWLW
jgi:hypothetical protein